MSNNENVWPSIGLDVLGPAAFFVTLRNRQPQQPGVSTNPENSGLTNLCPIPTSRPRTQGTRQFENLPK